MARTPASIERELRLLIRSKGIEFRSRKIKGGSGLVVFGDGERPHLIVLDPAQGGLIENAIHELLHVLFREEMEVWAKELDEAINSAIEDCVVRYINRSEKRVDWWRAAVAERLD
jgi:hypothetical protein